MFQSLRQGITYVTWVRYQEITRAEAGLQATVRVVLE
jgi:hypothetical protein